MLGLKGRGSKLEYYKWRVYERCIRVLDVLFYSVRRYSDIIEVDDYSVAIIIRKLNFENSECKSVNENK